MRGIGLWILSAMMAKVVTKIANRRSTVINDFLAVSK